MRGQLRACRTDGVRSSIVLAATGREMAALAAIYRPPAGAAHRLLPGWQDSKFPFQLGGITMLSKSEIHAFHKKLEEMADRLSRDCSQLATENSLQQDAPDQEVRPLTDDGTIAREEASITMSLLANEQQMLDEISAALDRLDNGTFGRCEGCQQSIPKARLRALPYVRYCTACASTRE
jgi:RNA polymerase-binding transcription factor DksA